MPLNKRGTETLSVWFFIDLILLAVILMMLFQFISKVGDNSSFQKIYLAEDISLLMDAMYSAPGNLYINYPQDMQWFNVNFEKNRIEVFEKNEDQNLRGIAYFMEDQNINFQHVSYSSNAKKNSTFIHRYMPVFELLKLSKHKDSRNESLNLTFVKDYNQISVLNKGKVKFSSVNCRKEKFSQKVLFGRDDRNSNFFSNTVIGNAEITQLGETKIDDLLIYPIVKESEVDYIKIYFNAESKKSVSIVACNLATSISEIESLSEGITLIPYNQVMISKKIGRNIENSILIELGLKDKSQLSKIGYRINLGLKSE